MMHQINNHLAVTPGLRQGRAVQRPVFRSPLITLLALTLTLSLSSCVMTPTATTELPRADTICAAQASLVNPMSTGSGIGGTGIRVANNGRNGNDGGEGGIGGTGIAVGAKKPVFGDGGMGGTGIVGVITGFASICVNGIEVNYDTNTPVWDNGKPSAISQLVVGQVVSVAVTEAGDQLRARGIGVIQAVVGPISMVNAATGELRVMGQSITAPRAELAALKVGNWLRVSGHRLVTGEVVSSHLQVIPVQANMQAQVRGSARDVVGKFVKLGDTRVDLSSLAAPVKLSTEQELWVSGFWNGQALQASDIVVSPTLQGLGSVEKVVIEGYIHTSGSRGISLGSELLALSDRVQVVGGSRSELVANRRVQISGRVGSDKRITVERVEFSRSSRIGGSGRSTDSRDDAKSGKSGSDDAKSGSGGSGSGSSGSGSSGSGSSGSGSSGSGSSGSGSSGSGKSGSGK